MTMLTIVLLLAMIKTVHFMAPEESTLTVYTIISDMEERFINLEKKFDDVKSDFSSKERKLEAELHRMKRDYRILKRKYSNLEKTTLMKMQSIEDRCDVNAEKELKTQAEYNVAFNNESSIPGTDSDLSLTARRQSHGASTLFNSTNLIKTSYVEKLSISKTGDEVDPMKSNTRRSTFKQTLSKEHARNRSKSIGSRNTPVVHDSAVAFYAQLRNRMTNVGDNQLIVFDDVITLEGNGYSSTTGIFTCPVPGIYVFSVTLLTLPGKFLEAGIIRNGDVFAILYSYNDNHFGSSSNTAIVRLITGDKVWVRINGKNHHNGTILDNRYSTFTGFLLHM